MAKMQSEAGKKVEAYKLISLTDSGFALARLETLSNPKTFGMTDRACQPFLRKLGVPILTIGGNKYYDPKVLEDKLKPLSQAGGDGFGKTMKVHSGITRPQVREASG